MTNTSKLRGRIVEKGFTLESFSEAVGMTRQTLRHRLDGTREFKVSEIQRSCEVLSISRDEIGDYFFAKDVPVSETSDQ